MIATIDRMLGRVTMYRLVLLCLAALALVGILLTAVGRVGALPAGPLASGLLPLAVLVSGAVLVGWSVLANLLLASVFRVPAHHESAVVTGLILLFLLSPTLDPASLSVDAFAATLAVASKFAIAPHGRHLLNPAAFGAFAVYSLGLQSTIWWVGTPGMLPFVVVLGALVLARTRRFLLVGVFLAAALAFRVLVAAATGIGPLDALRFALLSSPILFLGCFMLTEPLTLPPRRGQQLAVAVAVAGLLVVPFSLSGPEWGILHLQLTSAPELALLLGNVLAFVLARRRGLRLEYRSRRQLTPTSWEFEFTPSRSVAFRPGQYLELTLPHRRADSRGTRRTFSIASAPSIRTDPIRTDSIRTDEQAAAIRVGMRMPDGRRSSFKTALDALEPGGVVAANTIAGDFLLPRDPAVPVLLVAGGIGITPFISQLSHATASRTPRDTVLVYATSSTDELAYATELQRSGARVLVVAPEPLPRMPEHWSWIGAGPLTAELLLAAVPDARSRAAYLSGPPALIAELRPALRRAGVRRIRTDAFLGY
ncbi:MAG: hypothetical protein HY996_03015 [Micrococcales bacterium]|nr:hypothetical protein [Micrococcales bacterium]